MQLRRTGQGTRPAPKHRRYGAEVVPIAFELWGRLGEEGIAGLERLAAAACAVPQVVTKRGVVARWRRRLESALLFATSDAVLLALTGSDEEHARGPPLPRDGPSAEQLAKASSNRELALARRAAKEARNAELAAEDALRAAEEEAAEALRGGEAAGVGDEGELTT